MANKSPYVYADVSYVLKNNPTDRRGIIKDHYIFGKHESAPPHEICYLFSMAMCVFCAETQTYTGTESLEEIRLLIGKLMEFVEKQEGVLVRSRG